MSASEPVSCHGYIGFSSLWMPRPFFPTCIQDSKIDLLDDADAIKRKLKKVP